MRKRPMFQELIKRLGEPRKFIQVLLGPRQVGKTTLAMQAYKI
jgi:predicted AAA+ superfamily ATPase